MDDEQRFEVPGDGDRVMFSHRGRFGDIGNSEGIVDSVAEAADGRTVVDIEVDWTTVVAYFRPGDDLHGAELDVPEVHGTLDLFQLKVQVPRSQVERPGVEVGDHIQLKRGRGVFRVEEVEKGKVTLEDGMSYPVTHIGRFDEDIPEEDKDNLTQDYWEDFGFFTE